MAAIPPLETKRFKNKVSQLNAALEIADSDESKRQEVLRHIKSAEDDAELCLDVDFPPGLTWFNSDPLSLRTDLKGKLVVLDFFTYCCINCMHILPDLAELEHQHSVEDGLVIVGVHSAKFLNEKLPENISNAIRRYDIRHPVVNDSEIALWNQLGVVCWPTLVFISPKGRLLYYIIGEGHGREMKLFVSTALQYYQETGQLSTTSIPGIGSSGGGLEKTAVLSYPGKVCCGGGGRLYVSDTSHHRVVVVERESGVVSCGYGSGDAGLRDGDASEARFHSPQGLVLHGDRLFVADTENHAIRQVDLATGEVTTVAGTGVQGTDKEGGGKGTQQELSSPWDLALAESEATCCIFIAMAGTHQIWAHFLKESKWIKGSEYGSGISIRFTGSGEEANRNNSYPHKACFSQPSGLTLTTGGSMYVADSESSSVRCVSLKDGSVKALVGGAIDPQDLFAYGDVDGKGRDARLQHPLGVAWNERDGLLYVADSYNHKIKVVDPAAKRCTTLAGTGKSGLLDGFFEYAQFSEPGGLCLDPKGKTLFVADTNNHAIRVLDLEEKTVTELNIHLPELSPAADGQPQLPPEFKRLTGKRAQVVECEPVAVRAEGGEVRLTVRVSLPASTDWTSGAPSAWQLIPGTGVVSKDPVRGVIHSDRDTVLSLSVSPGLQPAGGAVTQVELLLYFCEQSGVCHMQGAVLSVPLLPSPTAPSPMEATLYYTPDLPKTSE